MTEFPSNSNTNKTSEPQASKNGPKVERITKGEVIQRKQPLSKRFKRVFFGGDARGAIESVTTNVFIPAARDAVADFGRELIEMAIFGESRGRSRGRSWGSSGPTRYDGYSRPGFQSQGSAWRPANSPANDPRRDVSRRARATHDFGEIILESRGEAEQVLDTLRAIIEQYNQASVSDLYEMVGITSAYTDQKYGWTNLMGSRVEHVRGGTYLLNLPQPVPLD